MTPRTPTSWDVARRAGVSRTAVSLVLNGRAAGNISEENQRAVVAGSTNVLALTSARNQAG